MATYSQLQTGISIPSATADILAFPPEGDRERLRSYAYNEMLFRGKHFEAFNITVENQLNQNWGHLRYIVANFAGLISKVIADMLFSEAAKFKYSGKENQAYSDALIFENKLHVQNYESALANSYRGDAVYKLRIGQRDGRDAVIIEDISPYIYFPRLDSGNMRQKPEVEELAWVMKVGAGYMLRKEIHYQGLIENQAWTYDPQSQRPVGRLAWSSVFPNDPEYYDNKIGRNLIVHVPNWKVGTDYFGNSDYSDLHSLFFGLNNRITKIDSILDKHSDPILAVPEGILDENGKVRREWIQVVEKNEKGDAPEYITWNANLDSAFSEIDQLVQMMFMFSEISPASVGMDKNGQAESGRALKLKLLRTIAKKRRKQLYYDQALKEVMTLAQMLAAAWGIPAYGMDGKEVKPPKSVETPEIDFADGIVNDTREMAEEEEIRLRSKTTTTVDAIMRLDGVDQKTAEEKAAAIEKENSLDLPLGGAVMPAGQPSDPKAKSPQPGETIPKDGQPSPTNVE